MASTEPPAPLGDGATRRGDRGEAGNPARDVAQSDVAQSDVAGALPPAPALVRCRKCRLSGLT